MTVHLPEELERSVREEVLSGRFASEDDLVAAAVRAYLGRRQSGPGRNAADPRLELILGVKHPAHEPDELVGEATRRQGQAGLETADAQPPGLTAVELADQALQRRLVEAGLLNEIKPPIRDLAPYRDRKAIPIQGEPLSETVIRERR